MARACTEATREGIPCFGEADVAKRPVGGQGADMANGRGFPKTLKSGANLWVFVFSFGLRKITETAKSTE